MSMKITDLDVSEYLDTEESIASYLSAIIEEGDPQLLLAAIGDVAKARGMAKIASDTGLGRESLYKALKPESKPRFETIVKILNSLGVKIQFLAIHANEKNVVNKGKLIKTDKGRATRKRIAPRGVTGRKRTVLKKSHGAGRMDS